MRANKMSEDQIHNSLTLFKYKGVKSVKVFENNNSHGLMFVIFR